MTHHDHSHDDQMPMCPHAFERASQVLVMALVPVLLLPLEKMQAYLEDLEKQLDAYERDTGHRHPGWTEEKQKEHRHSARIIAACMHLKQAADLGGEPL